MWPSATRDDHNHTLYFPLFFPSHILISQCYMAARQHVFKINPIRFTTNEHHKKDSLVWWVLTTTAAMALLLSPSQKCTCFRPITPNTPRVKLIFYKVQTAMYLPKHITDTQSSGLKTHQEFNLHITSYIIGIYYLVFIICFVLLEIYCFFIYWKVEKIGQYLLYLNLTKQ